MLAACSSLRSENMSPSDKPASWLSVFFISYFMGWDACDLQVPHWRGTVVMNWTLMYSAHHLPPNPSLPLSLSHLWFCWNGKIMQRCKRNNVYKMWALLVCLGLASHSLHHNTVSCTQCVSWHPLSSSKSTKLVIFPALRFLPVVTTGWLLNKWK